jgi:hypothetical protein
VVADDRNATASGADHHDAGVHEQPDCAGFEDL